jgi:hypothetical protein
MLFETITATDLLPTFGGWGMVTVPRLDDNQEEVGIDLFVGNPSEDGGWKFFVGDTSDDPNGALRIVQEPSLSIEAPDGSGQIVGAIVINTAGEVVIDENDEAKRFSWSKLFYIKGKEFDIDEDGDLVIDGVIQGSLQMLVAPDKNRLYGKDGKPALVGIFYETIDDRLPEVSCHEMEDMARDILNGIIAEATAAD